MVKIQKQLQLMHRDFRKIMDRINDTNARENIKKFATLLTEIEKVSDMNLKEGSMSVGGGPKVRFQVNSSCQYFTIAPNSFKQ